MSKKKAQKSATIRNSIRSASNPLFYASTFIDKSADIASLFVKDCGLIDRRLRVIGGLLPRRLRSFFLLKRAPLGVGGISMEIVSTENQKIATSCLTIVQQAISEPGLIHDAYRRFHGYSLRNQLLALFQCNSRGITPGPLATYRRWERLGRHVLRGQKALVLCVPITQQQHDDAIEDVADR